MLFKARSNFKDHLIWPHCYLKVNVYFLSNYHRQVIFKNRGALKNITRSHSPKAHHFLVPHRPLRCFQFFCFFHLVFTSISLDCDLILMFELSFRVFSIDCYVRWRFSFLMPLSPPSRLVMYSYHSWGLNWHLYLHDVILTVQTLSTGIPSSPLWLFSFLDFFLWC